MPDDLEVAEDIDISITNIKELPKSWNGKTINGNLHITHCPIKELPENLTINGSLNLSYCKNITELPKKLKIINSLYAGGSSLVSMPEYLIVGQSIDISETKVKELPKSWNGKTIKGYLNIAYCPIKELPENLKIRMYLYMTNTLISKLPDTLLVSDEIIISSNMYLRLTYIPAHLKYKIRYNNDRPTT